jgi:hypothetical protein
MHARFSTIHGRLFKGLVPFARVLENQSRTVWNRSVTLVGPTRASLDTAVNTSRRSDAEREQIMALR